MWLKKSFTRGITLKEKKKGFKAIKLDLEKAYDHLLWNFIIDSLKDLGLNNHFINLIWNYISTVSMNILWNGDRIGDFEPRRAIRQGDPMSPYLFVICMERLSHLIHEAVSEGFWKPISISRGGPQITHLCFADDFFIFAEASLDQVEVISNCLELFCSNSGQKVSKEKTKIYFSQNVGHVRANEIASTFGFTLTNDLGKYLGAPLHHGAVNSGSFSFVTDKLLQRLSSWKSSSLSLAGRLTLCKSIISAVPSYPMQTSYLPTKVCDSIDKICRSFLWRESTGKRKLHLVLWNQVCQDKQLGGLGLRHA